MLHTLIRGHRLITPWCLWSQQSDQFSCSWDLSQSAKPNSWEIEALERMNEIRELHLRNVGQPIFLWLHFAEKSCRGFNNTTNYGGRDVTLEPFSNQHYWQKTFWLARSAGQACAAANHRRAPSFQNFSPFLGNYAKEVPTIIVFKFLVWLTLIILFSTTSVHL